ncbi:MULTISPECIES: RidA family protein [unclassified Streptomyces]|uniref:RidA family protein n=1 Tax=unclassified Streptomyces TaxID=2593676 RepID=UPI00343025D6
MTNLDFVQSDWNWGKDYPMSQLVKAGDYLWLSGQIAFDHEGKIVGPDDLLAQARQVFTNMKHVLGRVGCELTDVVRLTNYFATPMDYEMTKSYWTVRREFFGDHRPASTGVQVAALMTPDLMLEVDAIVYAPHARVPSGD